MQRWFQWRPIATDVYVFTFSVFWLTTLVLVQKHDAILHRFYLYMNHVGRCLSSAFLTKPFGRIRASVFGFGQRSIPF
jgi:hypothetical protein